MEKVSLEQNSFEWELDRMSGIGSSDAPSVMGVSPYTTALQLWEAKVYLQASEDKFIFQKGHALEVVARSIYNNHSGLKFIKENGKCEDNPILKASFDGYDGNSQVILECKYVGQENFNRVKETGRPLDHHYPQLQHQLNVCGFKHVIYMIYTAGIESQIKEWHAITVLRDDEYIETLVEKEMEFWASVVAKKRPEPSEMDSVEVKDQELAGFLDQYRDIAQTIKDLTLSQKILKNKIQDLVTHPKMNYGKMTVSKTGRGYMIRMGK